MKLVTNARVYRFDASTRRFASHSTVLIDGARIVALDEDPTGVNCERIDLDGATLVPAFADCHVHLADTGYFLGEQNFDRVRSYAEFDDAVAHVRRQHGIVYAGQYDESSWNDHAIADAKALERHHSDARAMLVRIDGHSSIVNAKTFAWLDLPRDIDGIERDTDGSPTGRLFLEANWEAQARFLGAFPASILEAGERRAVEFAHAKGVVHLHAQIMDQDHDLAHAAVARMRTLPAKVYPKICIADAQVAVECGLPYIGGDVFLDGSLGSCTAALSRPYENSDSSGALHFSDDELLAYFSGAEALGVAAGVHAIGDAAIEQCVRVWERVLAGKPSQRGNRHFIEHFELATDDQIEACARMGIYLSMQPQFDSTWGNPGGMYDMRLGEDRRRTMNALGRAQRAGAILCGGDDSPVCPLDPIAGMKAATEHYEPSSRLDVHEAIAMYTVNAAALGYVESETGNIAPGFCADFAVLDHDPIASDTFASCRVMQTWMDGERVY